MEAWLGFCLLVALGLWLLAHSLLCRSPRRQGRPSPGSPGYSRALLLICHNQEQHIEGVIRQLLRLAQGWADRQLELGVVVVDDRSHDQTPLIVERLVRRYHMLRFVHLEPGSSTTESPVELGLTVSQARLALVLDMRGPVDVLCLLADLSSLSASPARTPGDSYSDPSDARLNPP